MPGWGRCRSQPLLEANVTYIKPFAFSDEAGEAHFLHLPTASLETVSTPADIHSMMLLLYLFGVIASTATVGGIPVDWDEGEFRVEGFLPNDTPVDSNANDLPPYVYPADLNPDPLNRMRDEANVDSFRPIADEPNIETTNPPAKEPNNEPTNDANSQLSDSPLTNLIDYDNSVTLSSSCNQFFGLACCTGNSYEAINVASGEALHLQDVSGCTPHDATKGPCNAELYCCFSFPAPSVRSTTNPAAHASQDHPIHNVENIDGSQCYPASSQADIPPIKPI